MDTIVLEASIRTETGKVVGRRLRLAGWIPAVVYGSGISPTPVFTSEKALRQALQTAAGGNVLLTLRVAQPDGAGGRDWTVLIKEIQQHPVTSRMLHVDFYQISLTKQIEVSVPVQFTGEAVGVKQGGGRLEHLLWEVRVACLPTQIPRRLEVDVSPLAIGDSWLVKDLVVPAGVKVLQDPQMAVVACVPPVVEKEPEAAASEAAAVEPEVIKQKKPEAEEQEAGSKQAP